MLSTFDLAHKFTAKWEGAFFDHPNDPGGATNYGVSLRWLKDEGIDIDGDGKIDIADIRALTPAKAAELFKKHFWDKLQLDALPKLTAIVTYDAAVNTGRGQAVKFLQRACNLIGGEQLSVDGALGPKTRRSAELIALLADRSLAELCIQERAAFHNMLCDNSPYPDGRDFRPFRRGWLNRTSDLHGYFGALAKECV